MTRTIRLLVFIVVIIPTLSKGMLVERSDFAPPFHIEWAPIEEEKEEKEEESEEKAPTLKRITITIVQKTMTSTAAQEEHELREQAEACFK